MKSRFPIPLSAKNKLHRQSKEIMLGISRLLLIFWFKTERHAESYGLDNIKCNTYTLATKIDS